MSSGGAFKILTNDGKADSILMAPEILKERICRLIEFRENQNQSLPPNQQVNPLPSVKDIEFTHVILFRTAFKPFVPIGYDYQRVLASCGNPSLDSAVMFDIPQYGEFLTDTVFNIVLSASSCAAAAIPAALSANLGPAQTATTASAVTITLPDGNTLQSLENRTLNGQSVLTVRRLLHQRFVDPEGNSLAFSSSLPDRLAYCEYPGERIIKTVAFEINGNPLDDYDMMSHVWFRRFRLLPNKRLAYDRNHGQEVAVQAKSLLVKDGLRNQVSFLNGPQTPKAVQPEMRLWVRCMLWFSVKNNNAFISASVPSGQRYISVNLSAASQLVVRRPACYQEAVLVTSNFIGTSNVSAVAGVWTLVAASHHAGVPLVTSGNGPVSETYETLRYNVFTNGTMSVPTVTAFNMYVNNIFTIPEIHDIYVARIGFSMVRIHRKQTVPLTSTTIEQVLNQFKYPVEFFYLGLRPVANETGSFHHEDWDKMCKRTRSLVTSATSLVNFHMVDQATPYGIQSNRPVISPDVATVESDYLLTASSSSTAVVVSDQRGIDKLKIEAQSVTLYQELDSSFFSSYLVETYSPHCLVSSEDPGALFVNFCMNPYDDQPSGHLNVSRAREFFINVTTSVVDSSNTANIHAEAQCINFLLVADGSAILRYTT